MRRYSHESLTRAEHGRSGEPETRSETRVSSLPSQSSSSSSSAPRSDPSIPSREPVLPGSHIISSNGYVSKQRVSVDRRASIGSAGCETRSIRSASFSPVGTTKSSSEKLATRSVFTRLGSGIVHSSLLPQGGGIHSPGPRLKPAPDPISASPSRVQTSLKASHSPKLSSVTETSPLGSCSHSKACSSGEALSGIQPSQFPPLSLSSPALTPHSISDLDLELKRSYEVKKSADRNSKSHHGPGEGAIKSYSASAEGHLSGKESFSSTRELLFDLATESRREGGITPKNSPSSMMGTNPMSGTNSLQGGRPKESSLLTAPLKKSSPRFLAVPSPVTVVHRSTAAVTLSPLSTASQESTTHSNQSPENTGHPGERLPSPLSSLELPARVSTDPSLREHEKSFTKKETSSLITETSSGGALSSKTTPSFLRSIFSFDRKREKDVPTPTSASILSLLERTDPNSAIQANAAPAKATPVTPMLTKFPSALPLPIPSASIAESIPVLMSTSDPVSTSLQEATLAPHSSLKPKDESKPVEYPVQYTVLELLSSKELILEGHHELRFNIPKGTKITVNHGHLIIGGTIGDCVTILVKHGDLYCEDVGINPTITAESVDCGDVGVTTEFNKNEYEKNEIKAQITSTKGSIHARQLKIAVILNSAETYTAKQPRDGLTETLQGEGILNFKPLSGEKTAHSRFCP